MLWGWSQKCVAFSPLTIGMLHSVLLLKSVLHMFVFLTFLIVVRKVFIFKMAISYAVAVKNRDLTAFCH